jgi:hypothetical protein
MPSDTGTHQIDSHGQGPFANVQKGHGRYRVVLGGIRTEIETRDSFAIKFSLLTKTPLSKMKHLVGCLPVAIWSGAGRSRAESILALLEEAGGEGRIVEIGAEEAARGVVKEREGRLSCSWCGFPMKEGDTRCEFCMTPVGSVVGKDGSRRKIEKSAQGIPSKRLLCYGIILIVGIIVAILIR